MAKITKGPSWSTRDLEADRLVLPLSTKARDHLTHALNERHDADPRVIFEMPFTLGRWEVRLRFGEVAGRLECVSMEIHGELGASRQDPITAFALRKLPIGKFVDEARREYLWGLENSASAPVDRGFWDPSLSPAEREQIAGEARRAAAQRTPIARRTIDAPRRGRRPLYGPEHFAAVSEAYLEAWRSGQNPTAAVATRFQVSPSAAAKWVARARSMGLLPPTTQGKPSGRARR